MFHHPGTCHVVRCGTCAANSNLASSTPSPTPQQTVINPVAEKCHAQGDCTQLMLTVGAIGTQLPSSQTPENPVVDGFSWMLHSNPSASTSSR